MCQSVSASTIVLVLYILHIHTQVSYGSISQMIYVPVAPIKLTLIIYLFKCLAGLLSRKAFYKGSQKMEKAGGEGGKWKGKGSGKRQEQSQRRRKSVFPTFPKRFLQEIESGTRKLLNPTFQVLTAYIYLYSELSVVKTEKIIWVYITKNKYIINFTLRIKTVFINIAFRK